MHATNKLLSKGNETYLVRLSFSVYFLKLAQPFTENCPTVEFGSVVTGVKWPQFGQLQPDSELFLSHM